MYIYPASTSISIYPAIVFPNASVNIVVVHKPTKEQVSLTTAYTNNGSGITISLPNLAPISAIAKNLDELAIRIFDASNSLIYEMVFRWVTNSPNILLSRKAWTKTSNNQKEWLTI